MNPISSVQVSGVDNNTPARTGRYTPQCLHYVLIYSLMRFDLFYYFSQCTQFPTSVSRPYIAAWTSALNQTWIQLTEQVCSGMVR